MRFLALEMVREPQNRLFIFDYAGEYVQLIQHLPGEVLLFRPGSEEFPLGINFLDWVKTLGEEAETAESWILRVLETLIRGRGSSEFTPKMEGMLRDMLLLELKKGGTFYDLLDDLWKLRTRFQQTQGDLKRRKATGDMLTKEEEVVLSDYGQHDLTVEAIHNRLRDIYGSLLRKVFFVRRTTIRAEDLLEHHVIIDLSLLRQQGVNMELLRLFCEFLLLYLSRGVAKRQKGRFPRRNIVVFEEAQQLVPEVQAKRTLADGTAPEELIGTLGGFGLTMVFISAQPGLLSRAIISGCHTKVVFGLQGLEASMLADALGVPNRELSGLQEGECLIRAPGTGVVKVTARAWREYPEDELVVLEEGLKQFPPALLRDSWEAYEFLGERSLKYYGTLVEVIEQAEAPGEELEEGGMVGCWAQEECGLCKHNRRIVRVGEQVAKEYWEKTKKMDLQALLKLYPMDPLILYEQLRQYTLKQGVDNAELVAFCAHWGLLDRGRGNAKMGKTYAELWEQGPEALVAQLVALPEIQELLAIGKTLFKSGSEVRPAFFLRDRFCEVCPLDKPLRDDFCLKYRQMAVQQLMNDPKLEQHLEELNQIDFQKFLAACFEIVSMENPGASFCLATAFLKRKNLSNRQQAILLEKAQNFLTEFVSRESFLGELVEEEKEVIPEYKEVVNDTKSPRVITTPKQKQMLETIETLFAQHGGIVPRREFKKQLQLMELWTPKTFYSILSEYIRVKKFRVAIQKREEDPRRVKAETYYISPVYHNVDTPFALYRVIHNFIMQEVKNFLLAAGLSVKDIARLDKDTGQPIISDLKIQIGSRTIYVEYTSGGRAKMQNDLQKIKTSQYRNQTVLLVALDQPPRRSKPDAVGMNSNKLKALEIVANLKLQTRIFTLTNLNELEAYCKTGKLPYTQ